MELRRRTMGGVSCDYGYIILNQNSTDPEHKVIDESGNDYAAGYTTPAVITAIRNDSHCYVGTFDSTRNVMSLKQLDDTDGTVYADSTSAASDITSTDHNVFMRLPEFYTRATEITSVSDHTPSAGSTIWKIEFAYGGNPGSRWRKWGGNDLIGKYEAYRSNDKLYSLSGKTSTGNISAQDSKIYVRAQGDGFTLVRWQHHNIMAILFYAYYGHTNSQLLCGSGTDARNKQTGLKNSFGMTDTTSANGNTDNIVYWGLENWWGNKAEWSEEILNYGTLTITEDDGTQRTMVAGTDFTSSSSCWPSKLVIGDFLDVIGIVGQTGGSSSTGYCDMHNADLSMSTAVCFSAQNNNGKGGVSAFIAIRYAYNGGSSSTSASYGTRIAYRGNIEIV